MCVYAFCWPAPPHTLVLLFLLPDARLSPRTKRSGKEVDQQDGVNDNNHSARKVRELMPLLHKNRRDHEIEQGGNIQAHCTQGGTQIQTV